MLDYLRNGGTLPPLPMDERLVERIRREFDFFCVIPNPVDDARTWVEKFMDGDFTAELLQELWLPERHTDLDVKVVSIWAFNLLATDALDYVVVGCAITSQRRELGAEWYEPDSEWKEPTTTRVLFASDLSSRSSVYELVSFDQDVDLDSVSVCDHEAAYCTESNQRSHRRHTRGFYVQFRTDPHRFPR